MKKTFRMRRVLTLSLASMMMLGGFQAAPFGGVKVVKAQQADAKLEAIEKDLDNFLRNGHTIEAPGNNEGTDGFLIIPITDKSHYTGNISYIWLSREEERKISGSGNDGQSEARQKKYFNEAGNGVKQELFTPSENKIRIPFADVNKDYIYLKYENIDRIYARSFLREDTPKSSDYRLEESDSKIVSTKVGELEILDKKDNIWKVIPTGGFTNLLDGIDEGPTTWKIRKKTDGIKFPSLPLEITATKKVPLTKEHLKNLTFEIKEPDKLVVKGIASVLTNKTGDEIKYKIGENGEINTILNTQNKDLEIAVKKGDSVKFYVGNNDSDSFVIDIDKEEKPDEQTVKKKDEKTIIFGDEFHLFRYKKEGGSAYKTPDKAEVTDLASGTYEVIKAGSDTKTHQFSTQGTSHTLTFDSEPLTIKLEAPSLPPIIYFPPVVDSSASEEKKTEEKKEEEKKETEKKAEEEKKEAEKKPETEQTESVVDEKKAESNTKIEKNTEAPAVVNKSVRNREKTVLSASVDMVKEVLKADKGNLNLIVKGGSIKLSHATLEAIFGFEAEKVSLNMKVSELKKTPANLTNRLASKKVYDVRVKVGKETINDYDLQGNKFLVSLDVKLAKAKKYFVLNVKTGERIPAKYRKGKLDFKTSEAGQFVIVK